MRPARRLVSPKLWAILAGKRIPASCVAGKRSELFRPESVSFTSSGDLMAVSNSDNYSISVYSRKENGQEGYYRSKPFCTISNSNYLNFIHDVVFTPCGQYLVAVGREDHALSMYELPKKHSHEKMSEPLFVSRNEEFELYYPTGVAMHPSGKWLAVANRWRCGITLYQKSESSNLFDSTPVQRITESDLNSRGLAPPHTLNFSPDGDSLVVVHKTFYLNKHSEGDSALSILKWRNDPKAGLNPNPIVIEPFDNIELHSVVFHPSGKLVAVTNNTTACIDVFDVLPKQEGLRQRDSISLLQTDGGPKGIAFTREGNQIAATTIFDEVLFFDLV